MTRRQAERLPLGDAPGRRVARVRRGYDQTVTALRDLGRLEDVDAALVALGRTLADAIDAAHTDPDGSPFTVGALAGRLHPIVQDLRGVTADDADEVATLLAALAGQDDPATGADLGD